MVLGVLGVVGGHVEGLEHDPRHPLTVRLRVERSLGQQHLVRVRGRGRGRGRVKVRVGVGVGVGVRG